MKIKINGFPNVRGFKETALFEKYYWLKEVISIDKTIILIRDPRAVLCSILRRRMHKSWWNYSEKLIKYYGFSYQQINKMTDLDTFNYLKSKIESKLVHIPDGVYTRSGYESQDSSISISNLYVSSMLVTNEIYIKWLYMMGKENYSDMTYKYINIINQANVIKYIKEDDKYIIPDGYENNPVQGVNWEGALLFANYFGASLLTELEWEICAQAGSIHYTYPWGDNSPQNNYANYANNVGHTTPVGSYPPNNWGLYDMAGNLREWCLDNYYPGYKYTYNKHLNLKSLYRVVKGGAWDKTEYHLKIDVTAGKYYRLGTLGIGFRLAFHK